MKKVFILVLLVFCVCLSAFAQAGVIKEISGLVEIKNTNAQGFVPAKTGDTLRMDTIISTGFKSTALVTAGSSTIIVRPLTRLSLAELSAAEGTETINVNLQAGRVRVDVSPPAGSKTNMTVRGPSATASVRGTRFDFDTRNLSVSHGKVAFKGDKGAVVMVRAGSASQVQGNNKAADPINTLTGELIPTAPTGRGKVPNQKALPTAAEFSLILDYGQEKTVP